MELMIAAQSGPLFRALSVLVKRIVSVRRGGDYNEVSQAIQKKSRPSPSDCVTSFACKLLPEQGFGFSKADVVGCRVFASHFPSDEVQGEKTEVRESISEQPRDFVFSYSERQQYREEVETRKIGRNETWTF